MMEIDAKKLKQLSKEVNKLNISEDKIVINDDLEEMINQFLLAIMRISDKGQEDSLSKEMIDLYYQCCEYHDSKSNDTESNDAPEEFDRDKLESDLEEMDFEETETFIQDNDLDIDIDENTFEENQEELIILILDKMESKSKESTGGEAISMKSKIEKELLAMSFKELKAYVKIDPELNEIKFSKKDFEENKNSVIEKILAIKIKPEEDQDSLADELTAMSYKEVKAFIKEKSIDLEFKIKDWKTDDSKAELIKKIISLLGEDSQDSQEEFDREKLEEKLTDMDFDEFKEFVEKNDLEDEISDFDEDSFDKEQEDLIEEVLDVLELREEEKPKSEVKEEKENPLAKELRAMDFKAFKDYVKKVGLIGDIKLKKSSFDNDKDDLIKQILEKASTKKEEPKSEKAKKETKIIPPKKSLRKEGNTVQEIIARVIRESKKPLTKEEIIKIVVEKRGGDDVEKITKSTANFLNIVIQACMEMGVMLFDEKKKTYSIR